MANGDRNEDVHHDPPVVERNRKTRWWCSPISRNQVRNEHSTMTQLRGVMPQMLPGACSTPETELRSMHEDNQAEISRLKL
jgi:hypothetical protein